MQHVVGNRKRSRYIGPDTEDIRQLLEHCRRIQDDDKPQRIGRERLVATCITTGLHSLTTAEARVYEVLA